MQKKIALRKRYLTIRKKKYFEIKASFFSPLVKLINKEFKNKIVNLSGYYPSQFEVNMLKILELKTLKNFKLYLPVIKKYNKMIFCSWKNNEILEINKYGMLEPYNKKEISVPNIMLILIVMIKKNRLDWWWVLYYLNEYLKKNKKILTIGVAFSFQKHHKIPSFNNDVKLKYILTEKGIF